MSKKKKTPL